MEKIQNHINKIPQILSMLGIKDVVISPGSRSAPLVIAFARHPDFNCWVVPDERSAAFIGLGMALKTGNTTVLVCTSGSAAYNYAPAVAEAFFQHIPMLVLTADRPPEWIDQWDGQTIRQQNIFGHHVKKSYQYPELNVHTDTIWHAQRLINEAAILTQDETKGPVHVNIPFREPLYPEQKETQYEIEKIHLYKNNILSQTYNFSTLNDHIKKFNNIFIIVGQQKSDQRIQGLLAQLSEKVLVFAEAQSNYSALSNVIKHHDLYTIEEIADIEKPDLIIYFGKSIITKSLKKYIRNIPAVQNWYIGDMYPVPDTFKTLTQIIRCKPTDFLEWLHSEGLNEYKSNRLYQQVLEKDKIVENMLVRAFKNQPFSEFEAVKLMLDKLPKHCDIHVANSMSIRYVNYLGAQNENQEIYVNRGTSGIDGSISTAVGSALKSDRKTILITGDLAFFYDRNGLWHEHIPNNFTIFVLNNHGGGIFGMIDGPKDLPELEKFFITTQNLETENTAKDFNLKYTRVTDSIQLAKELKTENTSNNKCKIVEIVTDRLNNESVMKQVRKMIKEKINISQQSNA